MEDSMELPGLERLLDVCQRLDLGLKTSPPARAPLRAGSLLEGVSFDPVLASVYSRLGHAAFAIKVVRWVLSRSDDKTHTLEEDNKLWRENRWAELGEPVIVFGGDVYTYATVPSLADGWGRQPVVEVNTYELDGLHVIPVASNVDRFFDSYSRFLEALVVDPYYQETGETSLVFPWHATDILARDERLVELMRAGRFDKLMRNASDEERRWAARVMGIQG
jgi:hypothetical protein